MQRAVSAKGAFFPLLCLFTLVFLLGGCKADSFSNKLKSAEDDLSRGNRVVQDLSAAPALIPPPVAARHTIAMAVDSLLSDRYDASEIKKTLTLLRKDPFIPRYLKVEAGYLLILLDKLETQKRLAEKHASEKERVQREIKKELEEKYTAENDRLRQELDELRYKLQKIEEIHINTEKKRGIQ
jgi:hypothetical protein